MILQVTIPPNCGTTLLVQTPDGQVISAVVPKGLGPGQVFHVETPPDDVQRSERAHPQSHQHQQQQQQQQPQRSDSEESMLRQKGLVKLRVPKGLQAGDQFKVRIPDGRTITVVVPPNVTDYFQVKVPTKKQNWHDNPLAVAPMVVGPFLM